MGIVKAGLSSEFSFMWKGLNNKLNIHVAVAVFECAVEHFLYINYTRRTLLDTSAMYRLHNYFSAW